MPPVTRSRPRPLSLWLLGAGIAATLAVNVLAGVSAGLLGSIVAAWPALAFVGCYELLMMLVRAPARRTAGESADELHGLPDVLGGRADRRRERGTARAQSHARGRESPLAES